MTRDTLSRPEKKFYRRLAFVCFFFYVSSMAAKNLYNAEIVQIINDFAVSKADASLSMTFYFVPYAAVQLVLAKILPKLHLRNYILITICLSALTNMMPAFCTQMWQVWIAYACTGFLQAGMWPACVLMVSRYMPPSMHTFANKLLSTGFCTGLVLDYIVSALFLQLTDNWRAAFWFFNVMMASAAVMFFFMLRRADRHYALQAHHEQLHQSGAVEEHKPDTPMSDSPAPARSKKEILLFFIVVCISTFFMNIAYYGVNNWIPSLLFDVFGLPSSLSTLVTVTVPISGIFGPLILTTLCDRFSYWKVLFFAGVVAAAVIAVLMFSYSFNLFLSLGMSLMFIVTSRGMSNVNSTVIPLKNRDLINAGSSAAIINALASIGAAAGPPIAGFLMDMFPGNGRAVGYAVALGSIVIVMIMSVLGYRLSRQKQPGLVTGK